MNAYQAAASEAAARIRREFAEDVADLLDLGCTPHDIIRRYDLSAATIEQRLRRADRLDLARRFATIRDRERRHPCVDCGQPGIANTAERCRPCGARQRNRAA